jgi:ATP-dependent Clp protease ATP-binding subunit ClpB
VARLVGVPPGFAGYEEGGKLTEAVRRRPSAVVVLDELEKAHPDVFDILLQVLEDGRLTDGQGRTVDFTNGVVIMTSNLVGEPTEYFQPEFMNRIDEIVRFHALSDADLERIVSIQLEGLRRRLSERRLSLAVTPSAAAYLARAGFVPDYGARPLRRVIQREVEDQMAVALLEGRYSEGSTITVDVNEGVVVLA